MVLVFNVGGVSKYLGKIHFAELWDDAEDGKRPLIEGFRKCHKIAVKYKE